MSKKIFYSSLSFQVLTNGTYVNSFMKRYTTHMYTAYIYNSKYVFANKKKLIKDIQVLNPSLFNTKIKGHYNFSLVTE